MSVFSPHPAKPPLFPAAGLPDPIVRPVARRRRPLRSLFINALPHLGLYLVPVLALAIAAAIGHGGDRHVTAAITLLLFGVPGLIANVALASLVLRARRRTQRFLQHSQPADAVVSDIETAGTKGKSDYERTLVLAFHTAAGTPIEIRADGKMRKVKRGDHIALRYDENSPSTVRLPSLLTVPLIVGGVVLVASSALASLAFTAVGIALLV